MPPLPPVPPPVPPPVSPPVPPPVSPVPPLSVLGAGVDGAAGATEVPESEVLGAVVVALEPLISCPHYLKP
jgi:hypothetical protein